ncbi:MAG TPA: hypothetical protein VK846_12355 [Candidatus Limnocylindria bacterium]|nr:hypothetical protein [Candidatus Limnocylindria bacterium]
MFPDTYSERLARASDTFRQLSSEGVLLRKVDVVAQALLAWATADGAARAEYARHLAGTLNDGQDS